MRGSEKQIQWATEISETVTSILRAASKEIEDKSTDEAIKQKNISDIAVRIAAIESAEYAGDIINLFKDIKKTGNTMKDFSKVLSVYRYSLPYTEGEKAILCK